MKKCFAVLCLAALLAGLYACGETEPIVPDEKNTAETMAEPAATAAQAEPTGLRIEGYDYAPDGEVWRNDDGSPVRAFDTDGATCRYEERDGGVYLTYTMDTSEDEGAVFTLPDYVDGKPLLGVADGGLGLKNIHCGELRLPGTMKEFFISTSIVETIVIPASVEVIEFDRTYYRDVVVDPVNPNFSAMDGILVSKDNAVLIRYPTLREGKSYTVPANITEIAPNAFSRGVLEEIVIPPTVTKMPEANSYWEETLGFRTTIVAAPGSTAEAFVKKCIAEEIELKLVLRDFS